MEVFYNLFDFQKYLTEKAQETTISIGNFDGIHAGHRILLKKNIEVAKSSKTISCVFTFSPHPVQFFSPQVQFESLFDRDDQILQLRQLGIGALCIISFDEDFSKMSALDFLNLLKKQLKLKNLVLGSNFNFGRNREGNSAFIASMKETMNFEYFNQILEKNNTQVVSTSHIKSLLKLGHVSDANLLLQRNYYIKGKIQQGDQRGRKIGFPTANIVSPKSKNLALGVYKTRCFFVDDENNNSKVEYLNSITNVGYHPTFKINSKLPIVETHFFDWSGDCYNKTLVVEFISFLRPEKKFSSLEELKNQISEDILRSKIDKA